MDDLKIIKIGNYASIAIDLFVFLMQLVSVRSDGKVLLPIMLILTLLHALVIGTSYYFLKKRGMSYRMPVHQRYLILGVALASAILFMQSMIMGEVSRLFLLLINGCLVLVCPIARLVNNTTVNQVHRMTPRIVIWGVFVCQKIFKKAISPCLLNSLFS